MLLLPSSSNAQLWPLADSLNRATDDDYVTGAICLESGNFIIVSSGLVKDPPFSLPSSIHKTDQNGVPLKQYNIPKVINNTIYLAMQSVLPYGKDSFVIAGIASDLTIGNGYTFTKLALVIIDTALTGYRYEILNVDYPDEFNMNAFVKYKWLNGRCYAIVIANTPDTSEFGLSNQRNFYIELLPNLSSINKIYFDRIGHLGTDLDAIEERTFLASKGSSGLIFNTRMSITPTIVKFDSSFNVIDTNGFDIYREGPIPSDVAPFLTVFNPIKQLRPNKNIVVGPKPSKPAKIFIICFDDSLNTISTHRYDSSENTEIFYVAYAPSFDDALLTHANGDITMAYTRDGIAEANKQDRITSIVLLRVDSTFNQIWKKDVVTGYSFAVEQIIATKDNGYLVVGTKGIKQPGEQFDIKTDIFIYKVNGNGTITNVSLLDNSSKNYNVYPFPNPSQTNISFIGLPIGNFTCTIIDAKGKSVLTNYVNSESSISINELPAGIYYYNIINTNGELLYAGKLIHE